MKILSEKDMNCDACIATIGFFDGVHCGHKYVLDQLKLESTQSGLKSMVISFSNHPMLFFNPHSPLRLLSTPEEKLSLIAHEGIDMTLMFPFQAELASLSSREFLRKLADDYGVKRLLVGYDHRFGSDRDAVFADYQCYGQEVGVYVELLEPLSVHRTTVSSSKIRKFLIEGEVDLANEMLGYRYFMEGTVVSGHQLGRKINFPTANLQVDSSKLIPKTGVYAIDVTLRGALYKGLVNIGTRPTVNGDKETIEVYILDFDDSIYNETLSISFISRLRDEKKFASLEELKSQIEKDKEKRALM